tara:strand:+ start:287 stop:502 length:216 start_codon:yes stop_codon:yes gene_type:complete
MNKKELIEEVKRHAIRHYEIGGWDHVVECLDDAAIADLIGDCRTVRGAIAEVEIYATHCAETRDAIESTIW